MGVASRKRARKAGGVHQRRKRLKKTLPNKLRVPKANLNQAPPELTAAWDHSKTMKQNYEAMGLSYDPNMRRPKRRTDNKTIEFANLEEAEKEHHIPEGEIRVVRALIKKHGDDYQAMARDHRINDLQHTARQLQKKCERYLKSVAYMMSLGDLDGAPAAEENDDHDDDDSNSEE